MIVPQRRISKARKGKRRSHLALSVPIIVNCQKCGKPIKPHCVCKYCGFYKGRKILKI